MFAIRGDDESDPDEDLLEKGTQRLQMIPPEALSSARSEEKSKSSSLGDLDHPSPQPVATSHDVAAASSREQPIPLSSATIQESDIKKHFTDVPISRSEGCVCKAESFEVPDQRSPTVFAEAPRCSYKPEVDGPPIVGLYVLTLSTFRGTEIRARHPSSTALAGALGVTPQLPPHRAETDLVCNAAFVIQRIAWRVGAAENYSDGGGSLAERERRLQQWVEMFALPERSPFGDNDLEAFTLQEEANEVDRGDRNFIGSASHLFFIIPLEGETTSFLFGVCCYCSLNESAWEASAPAESKGLCGLCLVSRVPFWGLLLFRLRAVSAAFFQLLETQQTAEATPVLQSGVRTIFGGFQGAAAKQMLDDLYIQLNTVNFHLLRYTEITFNLDAGLPPFIATLDPRALLALTKAMLLERKILFLAKDASKASTSLLCFLSLFPGGLACGFSSDGFGEHEYRWRRFGFPLQLFERRSAFYPILPLALADDLLLQKRGFLCASSNPALATHPVVKPDVIVDADALEMRITNPLLEPLLQLTTWEEAFSQRLLFDGPKDKKGHVTSGGSKASDIFQQTFSSLATHAAAHGFSFLRSSRDEGSTKGDPINWLQADGSRHAYESGTCECKRAAPSSNKEENAQASKLKGTLDAATLCRKQSGVAFSEVHRFAMSDASSSCDGSCSPEEYTIDEVNCGDGNSSKIGFSKGGGNSQSSGSIVTTPEQSQSKSSWMRWARERVSGSSSAVPPVSVGGSLSGSNRMRGCLTSSGRRWGEEAEEEGLAIGKPISLDRDWEAVADGVRAALWSHLETFSQRAALAAGPTRSRKALLDYLDNKLEGPADGVEVFGREWVKAWCSTHNFDIWRHQHRLPTEAERIDATRVSPASRQPPPTCGYARFVYENGDCYEGQFFNAMRHGEGVYTNKDGMRYEGSWEGDERHGEGVLAHEASGFLYVGQWVHNKKCGEGHLYSQKERYWGQFLDNKYHGKGRYVQRNGMEYEGEFVRGRFEGLGKLSLTRERTESSLKALEHRAVIRGEFREGKLNGIATVVFEDGRTYTGELKADTLKPHGSGSMLFADGCSFDGNWQNGLRYGTGVLTIPSAILDETCSRSGISSGGCDSQREGSNFNIKEGYVVVEGMWEDDTPSAAAEWTISFPCGDKYLGHLGIWPPKDTFSAISKNTGPLQRDSNDNDNEGKVLPHGRGLCKHKSTGEVYDGEWKEGMRHGQGESISSDGVRHSGAWRLGYPHGHDPHESNVALGGAQIELRHHPLVMEAFLKYPLHRCARFWSSACDATTKRNLGDI